MLAEAARAARIAEIVRQEREEAARPVDERQCSVCLEPMDGGRTEPVLILGCGGHTHCFHAACLGRSWGLYDTECRCPLCRTPASAEERLCVASRGSMQRVRAQAESARVAEAQEQAAWDALPAAEEPDPAVLYAVPGDAWAGVGAPDAGWEAIDGYSVIDCVISPCGHLADVPAALRVDWARAVTQVLEFVAAARASGDAVSLERGLKWKLCLHDVLLRGPRRGTRGAGRTHGELAARFQAWRDGDRSQLITWWAADRARAWLRVRSPRHRRQAEDDDRRVQRVLELVSEGEISRAMRLLHSLGVADVTENVLEQLRAKQSRAGTIAPR